MECGPQTVIEQTLTEIGYHFAMPVTPVKTSRRDRVPLVAVGLGCDDADSVVGHHRWTRRTTYAYAVASACHCWVSRFIPHGILAVLFDRLEFNDIEPRGTDPGDGAADARRRQHRRGRTAVVHPLGRRPRAGRAGDQRRHRRRTTPHPRREGPRPRDRRRGRPTSRSSPAWPDRRPTPPSDRRASSPKPVPTRSWCFRSPPTSASRSTSGCPSQYHEAIAEVGLAADPVPAAAGARRAELRARHASRDGVGRGRRGDEGGVVRRPPIRRHGSPARRPPAPDHDAHRQRQLHPRVVHARRHRCAHRFRRGDDPRAGRHDRRLEGRAHRRGQGAGASGPAVRRRGVRQAGRRLPGPAQGVPRRTRRARGRARPPATARHRRRRAGRPVGACWSRSACSSLRTHEVRRLPAVVHHPRPGADAIPTTSAGSPAAPRSSGSTRCGSPTTSSPPIASTGSAGSTR